MTIIQITEIGRRELPDAAPTTMTANARQFGSGIGDALTGAGDALEKAARVYAADQRQRQDYDLQSGFTDFTSQEQQRLTESLRSADGSNAYDFTKGFMAAHDKSAQAFLAKVPETERPKWQAQFAELRATLSRQALLGELKTRDSYQQTDLATKFDALQSQIDANPALKPQLTAQGEKLIDASNLPDGVKQGLKEEWRGKAAGAQVRAAIRDNPEQATADLGGETGYLRRLRTRESAGDDNARNPGSTASGRYQFLDGTWKDVVNSPEGKAAGLTVEGKNDPGQQEIGVRILTAQNSQALTSAGFAPNEKNLYLAHFLGAGGAVTFLRAMQSNPDAIASQLFPDAASANRMLFLDKGGETGRGQLTLEQAYGKITQGFGDGGVPLPRAGAYADLPYTARLQARSQAEQALLAQEREATGTQQKIYQQSYNTLAESLRDGTQNVTAVDAARQAGWLTDGADIKRLYEMADARAKADAAARSYAAISAEGGTSLDPTNPEHKAIADAGLQTLGGTPEAAVMVWQKTGILPETGATALRAGLGSSDPDKVKGALNIMSNMLGMSTARDPFAGVKDADELRKAAVTFDHLVNGRGLSADEATRRIMEMGRPEYQAKLKNLELETKAFQKELSESDPVSTILDAFDQNGMLPGGKPDLPSFQRGAILADYLEIASERFAETGDAKASKAYALSELGRLYGVSNGVLMKYPPEAVMPPLLLARGDRSHAYIYDQARADVKAATGIEPTNVYLVPLPGRQTAEAWRRGSPDTPYQLYYTYKDVNGQEILEVVRSFRMSDAEVVQRMADSADRETGAVRLPRFEQSLHGRAWVVGFADWQKKTWKATGERMDAYREAERTGRLSDQLWGFYASGQGRRPRINPEDQR
jgi:hypothetical protein